LLSSENARWGIVLFALLSPAFCAGTATAENPVSSRPPTIHVHLEGFGNVSAADLTAVLESAANEIWRYCPRAQLSGIDVYHRASHPITNFERQANGRVAIGLTARDTRWAQYGFQFAHEFCHALANFSDSTRRSVRYPRHANSWLEESLCETASLFALRAMSRSWASTPPYPAWKNYARWLNHYAEQRLAQPRHQLPSGTPFLEWFKQNQHALRTDPARRDRNTVIAIQLLPLFEADPRGWETLVFLNRGLRRGDASLAERLAEWRSQSPQELRPFLDRVARALGVKL
jgi:hypothetical protein